MGRDAVEVPGQSEPTMNFGWDLTRDPRGGDTLVHEIAIPLAFPTSTRILLQVSNGMKRPSIDTLVAPQ